MKHLTKNSATKKLNKETVLETKTGFLISKTSIAYKNVINVIDGVKTIRTCYTSGSGRFTSNQDHTSATIDILNRIGIEFILTNDSPRGGLTGNLITITTKIK